MNDRERFFEKLVAIKMECRYAVGNSDRRQFNQGSKWLALRIQKIINEVGEPAQEKGPANQPNTIGKKFGRGFRKVHRKSNERSKQNHGTH